MAAWLFSWPSRADETYRLIHAVGNAEQVSAIGLSKDECEARKKELLAVSLALGTGGSVTCLPESLFSN